MKKTTSVLTGQEPVNLQQYEDESALIWSIRNIRLPKQEKWDFTHRQWQRKIFDDTTKNLVIIKPTQIGMTTLMLCKMFHFAKQNPIRAMYTLPRQNDVYDLVNGKLTPIMAESPNVSSLIHGVDNIRQKHYGNSILHFMESSTQPRMLDVDLLIHDEVDMSNQDNLEEYIARLDASKYGMRWAISTPTIEDIGIHRMFQESDQKYWGVTCPRCGLEQELDWDVNVRNFNDSTWLACGQCDKEIESSQIQKGRWVSKYPERLLDPTRPISGYAVSQLMVTSIPLSKLWQEYKTMETKRFYNIRLGKAYTPAISALTRKLIYDNCLNGTHEKESSGDGYFLGADQGNVIHAVVGKLEGQVIKIVHMEVIPLEEGFDGLHRLMEAYKIRRAVIDASPNRHSALEFVKRYPAGRAFYAFYPTIVETYKIHNSEPQVNINRGASFDALLEKIKNGRLWLYGSRQNITDEVKTCITHLVAMKRDIVRSVTPMGVHKADVTWINSGADHYAHAINYLQVAVDSSAGLGTIRISVIGQGDMRELDKKREPESRNPYAGRRTLSRMLKESRGKRIFR